MTVEKFKRARNLIKTAQRQQADVSVDGSDVMQFPSRLTDTVSSVDSDVAAVRFQLRNPEEHEGAHMLDATCTMLELVLFFCWRDVGIEGKGGFFDSCLAYGKALLVAVIDQTVFVSQQTFNGSDLSYPLWMEKVRLCSSVCGVCVWRLCAA